MSQHKFLTAKTRGHRITITAAAVFMLTCVGTLAQSITPNPGNDFTSNQQAYKEGVSKIEAKYAAILNRAPSDYTNALTAMHQTFIKKGDLKAVVAIDAEKARFIDAPLVTEAVLVKEPEELKALQEKMLGIPDAIDRRKKGEINALTSAHIAKLDILIRMLTQASKIQDALFIQQEMDKLKAIVVNTPGVETPAVPKQVAAAQPETLTERKGSNVPEGGSAETVPRPKESNNTINKLVILDARFGAGGTWQDVTVKVQQMVKDNILDARADTDTFGDPTPGTPKRILISYQIGSALKEAIEVPEGGVIFIREDKSVATARAEPLTGKKEPGSTEKIAEEAAPSAKGSVNRAVNPAQSLKLTGTQKEETRTLAPQKLPYELSGVYVVPAGKELRLGPGTIVYAEKGSILSISGKLVIEGTAEAPVVIKGKSSGTSYWKGIALKNSGSTITYVQISGAENAVEGGSTEIKDSIITGNENGIVLSGGKSRVENCIVSKNNKAAIQTGSGEYDIVRCTVTDNGGTGLFHLWAGPVRIEACIFSGNKDGGIRTRSDLEAHNCILTGNQNYDVMNDACYTKADRDFSSNWWGEQGTRRLMQKGDTAGLSTVNDGHNNNSAGLVRMENFLKVKPKECGSTLKMSGLGFQINK